MNAREWPRRWMKYTLVLAAISGYAASGKSVDARQPPAAPVPDAQSVTSWLDCVECTAAELQAIVALGDAAVPQLRDILMNGPSKDRLDQHQKHLEATWRAEQAYEQKHPQRRVPLTEADYVRVYQQKYITLNKTRAARALGAIATAQARDALQQARASNPPPNIRKAIDSALRRR